MTTSARASLQDGGAKEYEKADLQGSDALCAGLQGIVNGIGGVVGVWDKKLVQPSLETLEMFVGVSVMVIVVMTHLLATNSSCRCLFCLVVCRGAAQGVFRLEDGIRDQLAGVLVLQPVHDPGSVLPCGNHPRQAHFGKVLRYCRRGLPHEVRQRADGHFAVPERQNDPDPRGISQHREHFHGQLNVLAVNAQRAGILICIHTQIISHFSTQAPHGDRKSILTFTKQPGVEKV